MSRKIKPIYFILTALALFILPILRAKAILICNPIDPNCGQVLPLELIARIIKALLGFVGIMSIVNFVIAGLTLIWSRGAEKHVTSARDNLLWTTIGIATIFASYAVLDFIIKTLIEP